MWTVSVAIWGLSSVISAAFAGHIGAPDGSDPAYNLCEACLPDARRYNEVPGGTLRLVQVVTRHGDRTPTEHLPNDDGEWDCSDNEISESVHAFRFKQIIRTGAERGAKGWAGFLPNTQCLLGQMTAKGIRQHVDLGAALRKLYIEKLRFLSDNLDDETEADVYVRATDSWRTKQSAAALLSGLYPPEKLPVNFTKEMVVYPLEAETLKGRGALAYCPRFRQLRRQMYQDPAYIGGIETIAPGLQSTLEKLLGTQGKRDFNAKSIGWDSLSGFVPPRLCSGKPLPCNKDGKCMTLEQGLTAVAARQLDYTWMYRDFSSEYSKLYIGPMMGELADMARDVINSGKGPRFQLFSAHDSTVAAMLGFLNTTSVLWPPLRANLIFEYWDTPAGGQSVRLMYNGDVEVLKTSWCDLKACPAETWFEYVDARTPQDLVKECVEQDEEPQVRTGASPDDNVRGHNGDL
ncbi:histidine phosphatase superfamily [Powellomyces hirtus]|nr:histidine phosphatase superfamily [Powellomyces hirtus]